ncbi:MAG TPA: hypothetical protein VNM42_00715 [Solirubrobacterales bacterium]|nr:hypothetical protein [Solirubrobacterales bacterium]
MTDAPSRPQVGPSPAPGSGRPAATPRLGRIALIVIVVVGLLWLGSWIAWAILAPDIEVHYRDHPGRHHGRPDHGGFNDGPNRLTGIPATVA